MPKSPRTATIHRSIISILWLLSVYHVSSANSFDVSRNWSTERVARSVLHKNVLNYVIPEESQRGTLIGDVARDILSLLTNVGHDETSAASLKLDLTVTNWRDRAVQLFRLDMTTGQLRIASPPDRETICMTTGLINSEVPLNYLQSSQDDLQRIVSNEDAKIIRGHIAVNNPCYVDLKIAYTIREAEKSSLSHTDKNAMDQHAPNSDPGLITVRIQVLDINDHAPVFPQSRLSSELGELSALPEKTTIDLPAAFDPDAGENGTISYWLVENPVGTNPSTSHVFESVPETPGDVDTVIPFRLAGEPLRLILTKKLDWETKHEYDLIMYAKDYGKPQSLTGQLSIHIAVRDENDNVPRFSETSYKAVINESVFRGTIIMELSASDADGTTNGQLTFSLAPPTNSQERLALQYFGIRTISSNQAAIYVIQTPDVDMTPKSTFSDQTGTTFDKFPGLPEKVGKQFNFHAIVRDNGYPRQLSSRTEITVFVLDVNDMPPNIFVSYLNPNGEAVERPGFGSSQLTGERSHGQVKENSNRAFIAFVNVQDFDAGEWGQVRCFTNNDAFELLPINEASTTKSESFGQFVGTQGTLRTSSLGAGETGFKLLAVKPFDREKVSEISFHIICVDNPQYTGDTHSIYANHVNPYLATTQLTYGSSSPSTGSVQLTGTALVRIFVTDENDNAPVFSRPQYSFVLDEVDESGGRTGRITPETQFLLVGRVTASDQDSTSQPSYHLVPELHNQFRIERETGKIYALKSFDREEILGKLKQDEYPQTDALRAELEADKLVYLHFNVFATDGVHNSTAKVRVLIRDVNDNAPVFTHSNYEFIVSENEQPIQSGSIGTVEAYDLDADANSQIVYQINDITDPSSLSEKSENQSLRHTRFTVNMLFTISAKTGQLHLIRPLDREKQSHHIFYVLAVDNPRDGQFDRTRQNTGSALDTIAVSYKSHTATATVTVIVADVNDNAPTISYPTSYGVINVESGAPTGQNLFTVVAHDPDAGENGTVRFTLSTANFERISSHIKSLDQVLVTDGRSWSDASEHSEAATKSGPFSIDAASGIVFVAEKLAEQSANYLLVIGAHDLGRPQQRKTTTTVTVRAQNSQLVQALNNYVPGGVHGLGPSTRQTNVVGPTPNGANTDDNPGTPGSASRFGSDKLRSPAGRDVNPGENFDSTVHTMNADSVRARFATITDRTVVVILATIFALLLLITVVLVLLIKRRRDAENQRSSIQKSSYDCSSTNNTMHPDQPFLRAKSGAFGRMESGGLEHATCSINLSGSNPNEQHPTLPRLHPIILHDGHMDQSECEHLEYGPSVYGKSNIYSGETIAIIPSNSSNGNNDFHQAIPVCIFERPKLERRAYSPEQRFSNSTELLSRSGTTTSESVTLERRTNHDALHQAQALCSPDELDFYQRQGLQLNGRKTRNNKRYQTIDPIMGTLKMVAGRGKQTTAANSFTTDPLQTELSPSTLKRKEYERGKTVEMLNLDQGSIAESAVLLNPERRPAPSALDDLAVQLHRIKRADELDWPGAGNYAPVCETGACGTNNASRPSSSSSSFKTRCDHQTVRRTDGYNNVNNNNTNPSKTNDSNKSTQLNENFKSTQQTNKGVSFV